MPKYLVQFHYTPEGGKGLLKEGGTRRRTAVKKLVESLGDAGGVLLCLWRS